MNTEIILIQGDDGEPWADSRDVAKRLDRKHGHILQSLRDVDCTHRFYQRNFRPFKIKDLTGESTSHVMMTEQGFVALCRSLKGGVATEIFEAFVEEFYRMRAELERRRDPALLTRMEILQLAMDSEQRALAAEAEVAKLKPAADALEEFRITPGSVSLTTAAKELGQPPMAFCDWLEAMGWLYWRGTGKNRRRFGYQPIIGRGWLEHGPVKAVDRSSGKTERLSAVYVTAEGLIRLASILRDENDKRRKLLEILPDNGVVYEDDHAIMNRIMHDDAVYGHGED